MEKNAIIADYIKIYNWHKIDGKEKIKLYYPYTDWKYYAYLELLNSMIVPEKAQESDILLIFKHFFNEGLFEWSYEIELDNKIKLGELANQNIKKFENNIAELVKKSDLYKSFNPCNAEDIKKNYSAQLFTEEIKNNNKLFFRITGKYFSPNESIKVYFKMPNDENTYLFPPTYTADEDGNFSIIPYDRSNQRLMRNGDWIFCKRKNN